MEQTHLYSSHHNVNLLTAALLTHSIRHVVVCPGSRNAPIVHNLQVNGDFSLYSVTDERSAAFVALGLWLKVRTGVALCVTSGSALLNTLPGVAEAALRNIPLVIILPTVRRSSTAFWMDKPYRNKGHCCPMYALGR